MAYTHRDVEDIKNVMDCFTRLKEDDGIVVEVANVRLDSDTLVDIRIDGKGYEVEPG